MKNDRKLILDIGVAKDKHFNFAKSGNIQTQCPNCKMPIEINLSGLPDDNSITPTVDWVCHSYQVPDNGGLNAINKSSS